VKEPGLAPRGPGRGAVAAQFQKDPAASAEPHLLAPGPEALEA
jgi:hypothetical protein